MLNNGKGMAAAGGPVGLSMANNFGAPMGGGKSVTVQGFDTRSIMRHYRETAAREMVRIGELNIGLLGQEVFGV